MKAKQLGCMRKLKVGDKVVVYENGEKRGCLFKIEKADDDGYKVLGSFYDLDGYRIGWDPRLEFIYECTDTHNLEANIIAILERNDYSNNNKVTYIMREIERIL